VRRTATSAPGLSAARSAPPRPAHRALRSTTSSSTGIRITSSRSGATLTPAAYWPGP